MSIYLLIVQIISGYGGFANKTNSTETLRADFSPLLFYFLHPLPSSILRFLYSSNHSPFEYFRILNYRREGVGSFSNILYIFLFCLVSFLYLSHVSFVVICVDAKLVQPISAKIISCYYGFSYIFGISPFVYVHFPFPNNNKVTYTDTLYFIFLFFIIQV